MTAAISVSNTTGIRQDLEVQVKIWNKIIKGKLANFKPIASIVTGSILCFAHNADKYAVLTKDLNTVKSYINLTNNLDSLESLFCKDKQGKRIYQRCVFQQFSTYSFIIGGFFTTYKWAEKVGLLKVAKPLAGIVIRATGVTPIGMAITILFSLGNTFQMCATIRESLKAPKASTTTQKLTPEHLEQKALYDKRVKVIAIACSVMSVFVSSIGVVSMIVVAPVALVIEPYAELGNSVLKLFFIYYKERYAPGVYYPNVVTSIASNGVKVATAGAPGGAKFVSEVATTYSLDNVEVEGEAKKLIV